MDAIIAILNWLLPLLYLALLVDYGATFFLRVRTHVRNPWLGVVIAIHLGFLVLRGIRLHYPPLTTTDEILSAIAISTTMVYLVLELVGRDRRAGSFVFLLVFLFQYTSSVVLGGSGGAAYVHENVMQGWARLHAAPAILAYTALSLSGVYGLLHVVSQRNLKHHHFGMLFDRLPPLDLRGRMTWWALLVGFGFVTISIATGPLLFTAANSSGARPVMETRIILKIVIGSTAWIVCLVAILGKCWAKKSMTWVSGVAVTGFAVIMALLISSILVS
jgi:ABC-type uncharacterized transport system permease subunit